MRKEHLSRTKMLQKLSEQRKMRLKALLQNRSSFDLQSRYLEARKVAAQAVKMSKEYSCKEFGCWLDFKYSSAILANHSPIAREKFKYHDFQSRI